MILRSHNTTMLAIKNTVEHAVRSGEVPREISLSEYEARSFMYEWAQAGRFPRQLTPYEGIDLVWYPCRCTDGEIRSKGSDRMLSDAILADGENILNNWINGKQRIRYEGTLNHGRTMDPTLDYLVELVVQRSPPSLDPKPTTVGKLPDRKFKRMLTKVR